MKIYAMEQNLGGGVAEDQPLSSSPIAAPAPTREQAVELTEAVGGRVTDVSDGQMYTGDDVVRRPTRQLLHARRNDVLSYRGRSRTIAQWAAMSGINVTTLTGRLTRGWTIARALSTPVRSRATRQRRTADTYSATYRGNWSALTTV